MEVLVAVIAFAGALLAAITTGALAGRLREEPAGWLIAWTVTAAALCLSLGVIATGTLVGFGPVTFRAYQITGSLLAPLWLAVGVWQLLASGAATRLLQWLIGIGFSVVGAVIMVLDPVSGAFDKLLPGGDAHWDLWPEKLLLAVHVVVMLLLVIALIVAVLRWRDGDDYDADNMNATAIVAPTGMALVGALYFSVAGVFVVVLMALTAGAVWYCVLRPLAPYEDDEDDDDDDAPPVRRREPSAPPVAAAAPPRRAGGLGELVTEYRSEGPPEPFDYGARMQPPPSSQPPHTSPGAPSPMPPAGLPGGPPDPFGGPATGQFMPPVPVAQPAPEPEYGMPATGVVFPGAGAQAPRPGPTPAGVPSVRPAVGIYGLLTVFTLLDGSGDAFDKLAEETVDSVLRNEPDTLIFVCHGVKSAPLQRIVYELYRDEVAFSEHQRQPHMERFATERQPLVLATNVIELSVNAAKVVPLPTAFRM